jgi:hypothetical protein
VQEYNSDRCINRRGYPYPKVSDYCYRRNRQNHELIVPKQLWTLTNKFMRDFAVIAAGDSGWRNYGFTGLKCTPGEKEFFRTFHERGIDAYFVPESLTTAVK